VIYFVTICVANRRRVLANETAFKAFTFAIGQVESWRVLAAMLMPDHLHVIVAPIGNRNAKLGKFFRSFETLDASGTKCIMELAVGISIVFCVPTNRFTTHGCMCKRIRSELDWSKV